MESKLSEQVGTSAYAFITAQTQKDHRVLTMSWLPIRDATDSALFVCVEGNSCAGLPSPSSSAKLSAGAFRNLRFISVSNSWPRQLSLDEFRASRSRPWLRCRTDDAPWYTRGRGSPPCCTRAA